MRIGGVLETLARSKSPPSNLKDTCSGQHMAEVTSGCESLPYEVVFWDSEAPGHEGDRILFSESLIPDTPGQVHGPGWRSDRRCRFPVEIGLYLQRPCRLQQVVVVSESGLAPSVVECFVAGPTRARLGTEEGGRKRASRGPPGADSWRHNGSKKDSTEAARAGYLCSIFVRIGSADFSTCVDTASDTRALPPRTAQAVLSGLSFKGQFLRLVLWEAEGCRDNPGRQVSVTHVQVLGSTLGDERPGLQMATTVAGAVAERKSSLHGDTSQSGGDSSGAPYLDEDGNESQREENVAVEQALAGLGIAPSLISGQGQRRQACVQEREGRGAGGGIQRGGRDRQDTWYGVVKEATSRLHGMLQVAHAEERFNEAELLSIALDRARSLGGSIRSARLAQHNACRREDFDEAKRYRDKAMEAEIWLRQTVRDASEAFQGGERVAADTPSQLTSPSSTGQESIDEKAASRSSFDTNTHDWKPKASPEEKVETTAPFHDEGKTCPSAKKSEKGHVDKDDVTEGERGDSNDKHNVSPPWLDPACPRSIEPWKGVLLTLPWPRGVLPDFRTVFSHGRDGLTCTSAAAFGSNFGGNRGRGKVDGGGLSTRSSLQQPGALLRTVLRLVAASQDLRPPGPVPPDIAPFRRAGSADGRPPLCTFFFSVSRSLSSKMSLDEMLADIHDTLRTSNRRERGEQDKRFGRAFAQPAADATPSATALTNWVEDNPKVAWAKPLVLCFPFITSQQGHNDTGRHHLMQPSRGGFGAAEDSQTPAAAKEKGDDLVGRTEGARGKKRRKTAVDGGADVSGSVNDHGDLSDKDSGHNRSSGQSGRDSGIKGLSGDGISHEDKRAAGLVPTGKAAPGVHEDEPPAEVSDGLAQTAASFLPDVVGAGGFSEFVPLLDAIVGRVLLSAACAGFPAPMRESAIRICQAHLHQTTNIAITAYNAAAAPANTGSSARGAVFRAACLVAAQGLMDPADGPRLAAESLAMSAVSLWGSMPGAVGERTGTAEDESEEHVGQEDRVQAPASAGFFGPVVDVALPLRDLRWGLELVLACVAPYLADGVPEVAGNDPEADEHPPTTSKEGDKHPVGCVDDSELRRSSHAFSVNDMKKTETIPPEGHVIPTADNPASGRTLTGQAGGSGGTPSPNNDTTRRNGAAAQETAKDGWRRSEPHRCSFDANGGGLGRANSRSRLALRVVGFACRHPDVGTALVSSILLTWFPFFLRWGRTAPSRAHARSTSCAIATQSGSAVGVQRPGTPAARGAPPGEAEAAEALAAGAIHMLAFMVRTFPLLPLSDFSAEALAGAAEGGMAFEGGHISPPNGGKAGFNMPEHRGNGMAGRDRKPTAGGDGGGLGRENNPSSTSGRAQHAGETLMLELFLHASTTGGGGLDFLHEVLPALNTPRGINCAHETSSALLAETKGRRKGHRKTTSRGKGEGRVGGNPRVTRTAVMGGGVRDAGVALPSVSNMVEVRKRLPVPIARKPSLKPADATNSSSSLSESVSMTPSIVDDEGGGDDDGAVHHSAAPTILDGQDGNDGVGHHSTVPSNMGRDDDVDSDGHDLSRANTTNVGEYPNMSDSSSVSLRLSSGSSSSATIGSAQSKEEAAVVTPAERGDENTQVLRGEGNKASKVFPLSSLGNGSIDQASEVLPLSSLGDGGVGRKEVDRPNMESNPGATRVIPVATNDAAGGSGSVGEQPREAVSGGKKEKKSHGGGLISRLFRRGKA